MCFSFIAQFAFIFISPEAGEGEDMAAFSQPSLPPGGTKFKVLIQLEKGFVLVIFVYCMTFSHSNLFHQGFKVQNSHSVGKSF